MRRILFLSLFLLSACDTGGGTTLLESSETMAFRLTSISNPRDTTVPANTPTIIPAISPEHSPTDWPPASAIISIRDEEIISLNESEVLHEIALFDEDRVDRVAISPDGNLLAVVSDREVCLFGLTDGGKIKCLQIQENQVDPIEQFNRTALVWSPDGSKLAYFEGTQHTAVQIWAIPSGDSLFYYIISNPMKFLQASWSPGSDSLSIISGGLWLWESSQIDELELVGDNIWASGQTWKTQSEILIVGSVGGEEGIWDITSGRLLALMELFVDGPIWIIWSHDNAHFAWSGPLLGINVYKTSSGDLIFRERHGIDVSWSNDDSLAAIIASSYQTGRSVFVWKVEGPYRLVEVKAPGDEHWWDIEWSPGNDLIAISTHEGLIAVVDASAWVNICVFRGDVEGIEMLQWISAEQLVFSGRKGDQVGVWVLSLGNFLPEK